MLKGNQGPLDVGDPIWNHAFVDRVRLTKENEKSDDLDGMLGLIEHLPGEKVHYAYELLQNADDEKATVVDFRFTETALVVYNNGESFSEGDVWAVCSVGRSRKRRKIGFFGIGFKSVFDVTDMPRVISEDFNFEIRGYIYPWPKDDLPDGVRHNRNEGAHFVLGYSRRTKADLQETLEMLNPRVLLFLKHVREVRVFNGQDSSPSWTLKKHEDSDGGIGIEDSRRGLSERWFVFSNKVRPPPGISGRQRITSAEIKVAFAPDRVAETRAEPVYCYLPTRKIAGLPFVVQADFFPTLGRENVKESDWDEWLFERLGKLAAEVVLRIRESSEFSHQLYEYIPLEAETHDIQILRTVQSMHRRLKQLHFVLGASGEWLRPSESCIASEHLAVLLSPREVLGKSVRADYVDYSLPPRAREVLLVLGARKADVNQLVEALAAGRPLKRKPLPTLLKVYDLLARELAVESEHTKGLRQRLANSRFLLTADGTWVAPTDPSQPRRVVAYPYRMTRSQLRSLPGRDVLVLLDPFFELSSVRRRQHGQDETLEKTRQRVKDFLHASFGVEKSLTAYNIILTLVVPKVADSTTSDQTVDKLIDYVRTNLHKFLAEAKRARHLSDDAPLALDLGRRLSVRAFAATGERGRRPISETYLPSQSNQQNRMEEVFAGVSDVWFIEDSYFKKKKRGAEPGWFEFFRMLGAWDSPRLNWIAQAKNLEIGEYPWVARSHSNRGWHRILNDARSIDIENLFALCQTLHQGEVQNRLYLLWDALARNWHQRYRQATHCTYQYFSYDWKSVSVPSTFLNVLTSNALVLGSDGVLHAPSGESQLVEDSPANRLVLQEDGLYAMWQGPASMLDAFGILRRPTIDQGMTRLRKVRGLANPGDSAIRLVIPLYSLLAGLIEGDEVRTNEIMKEFEASNLVYLGRADRQWWPPSLCIWSEMADTFGPFLGYLARTYQIETWNFFKRLGIREKPNLDACLTFLRNLPEKFEHNRHDVTAILPFLYIYSSRLLDASEGPASQETLRLLGDDGLWAPSSRTILADDPGYRRVFKGRLSFLYAPVSTESVSRLMEFLGVGLLSQRIRIVKRAGELAAGPSETTQRLTSACLGAVRELRRKVLPNSEKIRQWLDKIRSLEVYTFDTLRISYILRIGDIRRERTEDPDYFYSSEENRLYVASNCDPFHPMCALELARLFDTYADEVWPTLNMLMISARTDELFNDTLDALSSATVAPESAAASVPYLTEGSPLTATAPAVPSVSATPVPSVRAFRTTGEPHEIPTPLPQLRDTRKVGVGAVKAFIPYNPQEGSERSRNGTVRKPWSGTPKPIRPRHSIGPTQQAAERAAHDIVEKVERSQGRNPIPVAGERRLGYDYESAPRKIEVKHSQTEDLDVISLTAYELKAAEEELDAYWVYVVTGLREGARCRVRTIQNPLKWLEPEIPNQIELRGWHSAVLEEFPVEEIGEEEPLSPLKDGRATGQGADIDGVPGDREKHTHED